MTHVLIVLHIFHGSVVLLFEDGIRLDMLEFGLEVSNGMTEGATIGTTTSVGEVVAIVLGLVTGSTPGSVGQLVQSAMTSDGLACQLPFPPPSFFTFLGSASMCPDLAK